ncbi:MAG: hypothetical protein NTW80_13775 [Deltaproteobacteria bacterium]|nr:hypothetical protein [Deltaproteobacteria bacterium]
MNWESAAIEEYKTLREESVTSISRQQQIVSIGRATIGVLLLAACNNWEKPLVPEIILLLFLPIITYLFFLIWIGEVMRMLRAGSYLRNIENKINDKFQGMGMDKPLTWENWLVEQGYRNRIKIQYVAISFLFIFISIFSIIIGRFKIIYTKPHPLQTYIFNIDMLEIILFSCFLIVCIISIWKPK